MPFTDKDKHCIKILRRENRYSYPKFIREFPNKNWNRRGLDHMIKKTDWQIWFDCAKVRKWQTANTTATSTLLLICYRVRRTERSYLSAYVHMVDIFNINFEPMTFWCIMFVLSILVSVNLIDINICKVLILHEMCCFCVLDFYTVQYQQNECAAGNS